MDCHAEAPNSPGADLYFFFLAHSIQGFETASGLSKCDASDIAGNRREIIDGKGYTTHGRWIDR
jgi:hypothetical protein